LTSEKNTGSRRSVATRKNGVRRFDEERKNERGIRIAETWTEENDVLGLAYL
jgi:hypothetical protein